MEGKEESKSGFRCDVSQLFFFFFGTSRVPGGMRVWVGCFRSLFHRVLDNQAIMAQVSTYNKHGREVRVRHAALDNPAWLSHSTKHDRRLLPSPRPAHSATPRPRQHSHPLARRLYRAMHTSSIASRSGLPRFFLGAKPRRFPPHVAASLWTDWHTSASWLWERSPPSDRPRELRTESRALTVHEGNPNLAPLRACHTCVPLNCLFIKENVNTTSTSQREQPTQTNTYQPCPAHTNAQRHHPYPCYFSFSPSLLLSFSPSLPLPLPLPLLLSLSLSHSLTLLLSYSLTLSYSLSLSLTLSLSLSLSHTLSVSLSLSLSYSLSLSLTLSHSLSLSLTLS